MRSKGRRPGLVPGRATLVILALLIVSGVVGYFIFIQPGPPPVNSPTSTGQATPDPTLLELANVSPTTMNQVGSGASGVTSLASINSSTPLVFNGKPEVLYVGAEFCPFCAAERWPMIVALDKFGTFTGIQESKSAPLPEAYPNTPTFTFRNASYASSYISFASVELQDSNHHPLQNVTSDQTALINAYDATRAIPFVDFANKYVLVGSQFQPSVLANASWTQIASQLNNASSKYALSIDAAANRLISAICKVDGGSPTSVCSQPFAQTLSYVRGSSSGSSPLLVSNVALDEERTSSLVDLVRAFGTPVLNHSILTVAVADEWEQTAILHFVVRTG